MSVNVVLVAAGSGTRLAAGTPKAFAPLAGRSLLDHALAGVRAVSDVRRVVIVVPQAWVEETSDRYAADSAVRVVAGGSERTDSVRAGLKRLADDCDVVLIHDAARCLTPPEVFHRVIDAVAAGAPGAVPGLAVVDTVKIVDEAGAIVDTPVRASLRAVQTPQGFAREVLSAAYARTDPGGAVATDDAALAEAAGYRILVVDGDPRAFKVTTPEDLERAARLLDG